MPQRIGGLGGLVPFGLDDRDKQALADLLAGAGPFDSSIYGSNDPAIGLSSPPLPAQGLPRGGVVEAPPSPSARGGTGVNIASLLAGIAAQTQQDTALINTPIPVGYGQQQGPVSTGAASYRPQPDLYADTPAGPPAPPAPVGPDPLTQILGAFNPAAASADIFSQFQTNAADATSTLNAALSGVGVDQSYTSPDLSLAKKYGIDTTRLLDNIAPALAAERRLSNAAVTAAESTVTASREAGTLREQTLDLVRQSIESTQTRAVAEEQNRLYEDRQDIAAEVEQARKEQQRLEKEALDAEEKYLQDLEDRGLYAETPADHTVEAFSEWQNNLDGVSPQIQQSNILAADPQVTEFTSNLLDQAEPLAREIAAFEETGDVAGADRLRAQLTPEMERALADYDAVLRDPQIAAMDAIAEIVRGELTTEQAIAALRESREGLLRDADLKKIEESIRRFFGINKEGRYSLGQPAFMLAGLNNQQIAWMWGWDSDPRVRLIHQKEAAQFYDPSVADPSVNPLAGPAARPGNPFPFNPAGTIPGFNPQTGLPVTPDQPQLGFYPQPAGG